MIKRLILLGLLGLAFAPQWLPMGGDTGGAHAPGVAHAQIMRMAGGPGIAPPVGGGGGGNGLQTWSERSTQPGVVYATDFETSAEVTSHVLADGQEAGVFWENTVTAGGSGALGFNVEDADGANSGSWFNYLATDHRTFGNGTDYYVQYRYRVDEAMWRYHPRVVVAFDAGNDDFSVGATITGGTSGATCVAAVVVLESGAWSGTAAGHVVCSSKSGTFVDNESLTASSPTGHATATNLGFPSNPQSDGGGFKLSIFSCFYNGGGNGCTGSNQTNEIVIQNTLYRDYLQAYWQNTGPEGPFTNAEVPRSTPCNGSNFALQNAVDDGSPSSPSTCAQYADRYGPLYDYGSGSNTPQSATNDITADGAPRSEALGPGGEIDDGTWYSIKTHVTVVDLSTNSNRLEVWFAADGDDYSAANKIIDRTDVRLSTANSGYTGLWLLPYDTGKQSYAKGRDAKVYYDQLIVSTADIAAPTTSNPAGGSNSLSSAFAALTNGQWGTLTATSLTSALIKAGESGADSIMTYADKGAWDPVNNDAYFYGGTHANLSKERQLIYDAATNVWSADEDNTPEDTGPCVPAMPGVINECQPHHGYEHMTLREADSEIFHRNYSNATIQHRSPGEQPTWTSIATMGGSLFTEWDVANSIVWYPELYSGAGGLVFSSSGDYVTTWRETGNAWTVRRNDTGVISSYSNWSVYNRDDNRVYLGGGTRDNNQMWRLDPDGTMTQVADTPFACGTDPNVHCYVFSPGDASHKMVAISTTGSIREYTPGNPGSWSAEIDTLPFTPANNVYFGIPIEEYGGILFVTTVGTETTPSTTMHLWKHAVGAADVVAIASTGRGYRRRRHRAFGKKERLVA